MPKHWLAITSVVILTILFFTVFGERGLLHIYHLKQDFSDMSSELERVTKENEKLKREIEALRNDKQYVENIARKEFGLVKQGEVVYRFMTSSQAMKRLPAAPDARDVKKNSRASAVN